VIVLYRIFPNRPALSVALAAIVVQVLGEAVYLVSHTRRIEDT
jgi:hypothetical protein